MTTTTDPPTPLVSGAHRVIRAVSGGEGPWTGFLVSSDVGTLLWQDLTQIDGSIDWRFTGAEHVAAPLDIARSVSGHGVLLPWCRNRLAAYLDRRTLAGAPLVAGEWVTILCSLLRGLRELSERSNTAENGEWWLSDDGRPLCVLGGVRPASSSAAALLEQSEEGCSDRGIRRVMTALIVALKEGVPTKARVSEWERELFTYATPRPLAAEPARDDLLAPVGVGQLRLRARSSQARRRPRGRDQAPKRIPEVIAECWAGLRSRLEKMLHRRGSAPPRSHRRLVLVGCSVAAVVVLVGVLWPEPVPTAGVSAAVAQTASVSPKPASPVTELPVDGEQEVHGPEDLSAVAMGLLIELDACAQNPDGPCGQAIAGSSSVRPEHVMRSADAGEPTLLDDYGDIAVVRIGTQSEEQILVLIRQDEIWLVRDAYDVADQPVSK